MMTFRRVGLGIVFLVGCSSGSKSMMGTAGTSGGGTMGMGGAGGGSAITIDNFAQKYAEALCAKNFTCCDASELTGKTQSKCVSDNAQVLSLLTAEIAASQTQGRASFDPSASATCVNSLTAMTCAEFKQGASENMTACMALIMPKVAMGGACTQSYECTTANCQGADTSASPPVDGMCAAAIVYAAVGNSCAALECVDSAYCDSTEVCRLKKGAGETCTSDSECTNTCNTTTGTCSCYAGCMIVAAPTARETLASGLLLGVGLVFVTTARKRRRRGQS